MLNICINFKLWMTAMEQDSCQNLSEEVRACKQNEWSNAFAFFYESSWWFSCECKTSFPSPAIPFAVDACLAVPKLIVICIFLIMMCIYLLFEIWLFWISRPSTGKKTFVFEHMLTGSVTCMGMAPVCYFLSSCTEGVTWVALGSPSGKMSCAGEGQGGCLD